MYVTAVGFVCYCNRLDFRLLVECLKWRAHDSSIKTKAELPTEPS